MTLSTTLKALAALAILVPAAAQAQDYSGSMEFSLGLGSGFEFEPETGPALDGDAGTMLAITPGIDRMLGKSVGIGVEMGFIWLGAPDIEGAADDVASTLVLNPNVRLSMNFPIIPAVSLSAMIAAGPAFWTANDDAVNGGPFDSTRVGYGFRFNFGGGYAINKDVLAFMTIGYYTTTSYGDDITATQSSIPINVGLRTAF
ncbi:MAG: hypothetical protein ACI9U2_003001 [Bradymonadia bacterium]|jgi:hypothetical protein